MCTAVLTGFAPLEGKNNSSVMFPASLGTCTFVCAHVAVDTRGPCYNSVNSYISPGFYFLYHASVCKKTRKFWRNRVENLSHLADLLLGHRQATKTVDVHSHKQRAPRVQVFVECSKGPWPRTLGMAIEASSVPVNFENSRKSRIIEWHYAKRNAPLSELLLFVRGTLLGTF